MRFRKPPMEKIKALKPEVLTKYALDKGWVLHKDREHSKVYVRNDKYVVVPEIIDFKDYGLVVLDFVEQMAKFLEKAPEDVFNDLNLITNEGNVKGDTQLAKLAEDNRAR